MNVLGLITARGGSKGIPGKNLVGCGGHPLLFWTCRAARQSRCLSRTVISTDDQAIADHAISEGIEAPFLRPLDLATDTARSIDVACHAIEWLERHERWSTELLVLLQPTSPLRTGRHVDEAIAQLGDADSVVSVVEVPHRFKPWSVLAIEDKLLREYHRDPLPFDKFRRQDQPLLYARNGPAVVVSRASIVRSGTFYGERSVPYVMSAHDSVDIDDIDDLAFADWLLRRREDQP